MSKIQATQVITKLPVLPILKQEVKKEKLETADVVEIEPVPGTSTERMATEAEKTTEEVTVEQTMKVLWMNISKIYVIWKRKEPRGKDSRSL